MRILTYWLFPACVALGACGGKVVIDASGGTGGTGGSGGTGGTGGTSSSSSNSASASASSSSASASSSSGAGGGCPSAFPGIAASCDQEGLICDVPNACCGGQAECKGGIWTFDSPLCDGPCAPDCGPDGFACEVGTLCVAFLGKTTTYQCSFSPCFEKLSCVCVESLCAAGGMVCNNIQDGFKVLCDCNGPCN